MRSKNPAALIFTFFCLLYLLTAGGHFYNQDGYQKYVALDQIARGEGPFHPRFFTPAPGGKMTLSFPCGTLIWMSPLYGLGEITLNLLQKLSPNHPPDPSLFFAPLFVTFLNAFFTAGLCAVFFRVLGRLGVGIRASLSLTFMLGLGTILWPYSKFCYSEPQAAFFLLLLFERLQALKHKFKTAYAAGAGFAAGLALLTKYETGFLLPAFLIYALSVTARYAPALERRAAAAAGLSFSAGVLGILFWNFWRFDRFWTMGRYSGYAAENPVAFAALGFAFLLIFSAVFVPPVLAGLRYWAARYGGVLLGTLFAAALFYILWSGPVRREAAAVLWAPGKSLLIFSPVLIAAAAAFPAFWQRYRAEAVLLTALFFSYLCFLPATIQSTAWQWGSRFFVPLTPFLLLPLAAWNWPAGGRRRLLLVLTAVLGFFVQIAAVSFSYPDTMNFISQKIAEEKKIELNHFMLEREHVFPRLIHDSRYSPLVMQVRLVSSIITGKRPEEPREPLAFKVRVKRPEDWRLDFWWIYLRPYAAAQGAAWILAALFFASVLGLVRSTKEGPRG